jgi:hypothetical protein
MALSSTQLAYLTARSGAGRSGAMRSGFAPKQTEGATPGSTGPRYAWREQQEDRVATTWTEVTP